jgi:hypothetical protein
MSVKHLYLVAVAVMMACASAVTSRTGVHRGANLLTAQEIAAANADVTNVYDAVARLRPNWLAGHGVTSAATPGTQFAVVFVDGQHYGDLSSLRNIPASDAGDVSYYDVTQAGARFGLRGGSSGVIEVRIKVRE